MKKVLLFIVLLIMPISVQARNQSTKVCLYNIDDYPNISIKWDGSSFLLTSSGEEGTVNINSNIISQAIINGYCPKKDLINIKCNKVVIGGGDNLGKTKCIINANSNKIFQCEYGDDIVIYQNGDFYLNGKKIQDMDTQAKYKMLSGFCPAGTTVPKNSSKNDSSNESSIKNGSEAHEEAVKQINFCEENGVQVSFKIIGMLIFIAKIVVPLLLIIFGVMDFYKAMVNSDEKTTKEAIHIFARRIIAGIIVFFIPTIIGVILGLVDDYSATKNAHSKCQDCLLHPISKCNITLTK